MNVTFSPVNDTKTRSHGLAPDGAEAGYVLHQYCQPQPHEQNHWSLLEAILPVDPIHNRHGSARRWCGWFGRWRVGERIGER
jgi:hypothetical protein